MRRITSAALVALVCSGALLAQPKRRIAVMNFDYATVSTSVVQLYGSNQDIGKGIADLLVDRLVGNGVYEVVERKSMDKIIAEQNFSNSDRADPNSAAKLARLLGVDAIVIGSITQFGRDDKSTGVNAGGFGGFGSKLGLGKVGSKEAKAIVGITARLVSTETAVILASASELGHSQRSGMDIGGGGAGGGSGGGGNFDMSSSNFGATIIGEATGQCVTAVAKDLEAKASSMPAREVHVQGLVADASGGTLVINVGSRAGLKVGDKLHVTRATREIKDPSTGKVIRRVEDTLGEMQVTEVDENSAVGTFTGPKPAKVGDIVKN